MQGVGRPQNAAPPNAAPGSETVADLSTPCPVSVQGYPTLGVLDPDAPDRLVDTISEHVNASIIATNILHKVKEDNPVVAHDLLQELDIAPTELQAAADLKLEADESDGEVPQVVLGEPPSKQRKKEAHHRVNSADACKKTFRRRRMSLRTSIGRALMHPCRKFARTWPHTSSTSPWKTL
jgi:hypothetical protein